MLQFGNTCKFYKASTVESSIEDVLDFLLKRYSNIEYVMNLESEFGFSLILKAYENDFREKLYEKWLTDDARYVKSFDEYLNDVIPYRPSTDDEKKRILQKFGGGDNGSL